MGKKKATPKAKTTRVTGKATNTTGKTVQFEVIRATKVPTSRPNGRTSGGGSKQTQQQGKPVNPPKTTSTPTPVNVTLPKQQKITKPATQQGRGKATIPEKIVSNRDGREVTKDEMVIATFKWHNDDNGGHDHIILESIEDHHVSVGLTTDHKKGNNSTNYRLDTSPFQDGKDSHLRRQGRVRPIIEYKREKKGIITKVDHERAMLYGKRAKEKWLREQKEKEDKKNNDTVPNTHKD